MTFWTIYLIAKVSFKKSSLEKYHIFEGWYGFYR